MTMIGMNKCKLKLKMVMLKGHCASFVKKLQRVEFFSSTKRSSSTKNPVRKRTEERLPQKCEKEKDVPWSRDIRF